MFGESSVRFSRPNELCLQVARHQPVKCGSSGSQPWRGAGPGGGVVLPSKSRQGGTPGSCEPSPTPSRKSSTTSPPTMRRPSLTSPPQRPSRLPVVSQYPRPLSPPTSPQQSLRPRRFTPPLPPSPDQEQREPLSRGIPAKYTRKNSMSPNNSLVYGNKVLGSKRPASPCRTSNTKRVGSPKRGEVSRRQVSSPVLPKRVPRAPSPILPNKRGPSPSHARRRSPSQARSVCIKASQLNSFDP